MTQYPPPQPAKNRTGCWLTAIISIAVALILGIVGLFLPPINLYNRLTGDVYTPLQQQGDATTTADGALTFALAAGERDDFGARLGITPLQAFELQDSSMGSWIPAAKNAVPYYLALQSPVYSITTQGTSPDAVFLRLRLPIGLTNADLLDLYGWYTDEAGNSEWRFIPSAFVDGHLETTQEAIPERVAVFQAVPDSPEVQTAYDVTHPLTPEVAQISSIVSPGGLQPTLTASITGSLAAGFEANQAYQLMPIVRDFSDPGAVDPETVGVILGNSELRATHVREITAIVGGGGFDGIFIDYRGFPDDQRENFTRFIRELDTSLDSIGRQLGVVVPPAENVDGVWQTGAYDWRALGAEVDYLRINLGINPQTFRPNDNQLVEAMLRWATGEVNRYKLLIGLTAQSVREIAGSYTPIGYNAALAGLGNVVVNAPDGQNSDIIQPGTVLRASLDGQSATGGYDDALDAPYLDYVDGAGNTTARMWLTSASALRLRMDWVTRFALGGIAFDDLLEDDIAAGVLPAIGTFRVQLPEPPTTTEWALRWRIDDADGLVDTVTTNLNEDLVLTLEAPDGYYAINASVALLQDQQPNESSVRTGASVALFRPTPTPTPLPTQTPTPAPTATPTTSPIVATEAAVAAAQTGGGGGGTGSTNASAAGRINLSGFEYGGHVTSTSSGRAIGAMQRAGMTWMKVQLRYPQDASAAIAGARANGFKILIGTVGEPGQLASNPNYIGEFANWLAGIAAAGPDAIEVWNEPNIDREWPRGQINGAAYTQMLIAGYQAIKGANGNVIVISGAPAPTGAAGNAGCTDRLCNDDVFLRDMVNAGAMNYMDCVGVHYNEGIVSPLQVSGDIRDNYRTRYYDTMVNTYWSITGGQRPLCFTEIGFASPEGFPPLPGGFAWAQNVTVAQQAAWLAQAAAKASQSGRVRLMIVWNVDFARYDADPQAAYAIVRPDGGCPACDALAGLR